MTATSSAGLPSHSLGDEIASSVIHGVGIVLSIAGLATLVAFAALHGNALTVVACAVFGTSLVLLYTASTLYHSVTVAAAKPALRALDHIAIYVLIAGTYTPFTLIALPGAWGWGLFLAIWTLALAGSALELGLFKPFYLWRRLPYHHALWHVFVLTGSVLHFLAVLLYVIPGAAQG
jgi:hemolysin III